VYSTEQKIHHTLLFLVEGVWGSAGHVLRKHKLYCSFTVVRGIPSQAHDADS